jgi:hypothetical protein
MMKPVYMSHEEFLELLEEVMVRVRAHDSFEGFIQYLLPDPDDPADGFRVEARYRVGNRMGQGGMVVIADMEQ